MKRSNKIMVNQQYLDNLKAQIVVGESPPLPEELYIPLVLRRSSNGAVGVLVALGLLSEHNEVTGLGQFYLDNAGKLFY